MYPRDAITIISSTSTAGTYTMLPASTTPYTILYAYMYNDVLGTQRVIVGGTPLVQINNQYQEYDHELHYVFTNKAVQFIKSQSGTTTAEIIYVPRDRNNVFDIASEFSTSSTVSFGSTTISTMDATTTAMYQTNLTLNNGVMFSLLFVASFFSMYWLIKKFW